MRRIALILTMVAGAAALTPQDASPGQQPEIRGFVVEPETNQPVVDAVVSLYFLGAEQPRIMVGSAMLDVTGTVNTDATGAFTAPLYKVGYYRVQAKKNGYVQNPNSSQRVTLTDDAPVKEVRLTLSPPGHLTGWVVDEETGKPISGVRVSAARPLPAGTVFFGAMFGNGVVTDAEGQFRTGDLMPGEYAITIGEQTTGKDRILTKFSEEDWKTVDQDYPRTYWPGGHGADAVVPVKVDSGATVSVGKLSVKKVAHYRLHVRIPPSTCGADDTMQVYEQPPGGGMLTISQEAPCGRDMLITGYPPGAYRLILAVNGRKAEERGMASVPFVIADENVEVTAPLERGVRVDGTFVAADGAAPPDFSKLEMRLSPTGMLPFADISSPVKPDGNGKFFIAGFPALSCEVFVQGTGQASYVKEIRYNGIPITDGTAPLDKSAMAHSLTIVIDDKPAAIAGSVMDGDKPVGQPYVILAKWPLPNRPDRRLYMPTATATGDDQGKFQFTGLAPGEYRMVALRSQDEFTNRAPGVLEAALAAAGKIEIGPNGLRSVSIEIGALR